MYRASSGRSSASSSSRSKESSSSGSRSSRSGASTSGSTRGRSPRRSRSPSPRGRRRRSPSSSRSSRRSPSPRRSSRIRSPSRGSWSCIDSEQRDGSLTRRRSPGWRSRSPQSCSPRRRSRSPRSRSPGQRSHSPGRRSPTRHSNSPGRCSPARHSSSPSRRSPSRHSESSAEQSLRITVGNDRYGIDTPERKRLSDRLGSPVDSLSDVDRDDLADGPIFSRGLSHPRSLDRYPSREATPSSPFSIRHEEDYRSRDVFVHQSDYSVTYDHLHDQPRESDRGGELLRKSLYTSEDRGREPKRSRYDREDRPLDVSIEPQGFMPATRNYRKRSLSRSPSPTYLNEDFRELESARRKREEQQSRNLSRELPGSGYMMPGSTNPVPSSEPRYLYRPDDAPVMPKKSILKKRVEDFSVQPEVFSSSSTSVKEPPPLSNNPPLPQRSSIAPFSLEVENFLKRFNKNAVAESTNNESKGNVHDWRPYSVVQQNTFPFEQNSGSFLKQKEPQESTLEPADRHNDFLLPHERASQDGSGFSRILGMMADSTSAQEKRRRSFPDDIEDEEKFLYGDDENGSNVDSPSTQKLTLSSERESVSQKVSSPPPPSPPVKPDTSEESRPEYEKIHDLLKTIGLDIGVAEIGKLAARTQERLHGKKTSRSPDRDLVASRKPESRERQHSRSNTHSPESSQKRSLSPSGSFPPSKDMSSVSNSEYNKSKSIGQDNPAGTPERSVPPISLIPSAPPSLPNLSPPTSVSQYRVSRFPPFPATQLPQNYPPPTMPPPGYDAYGHYMAYAASGWPMYAQQADPALSDVHGLVTLAVPPNPTRPNLRVIETVSTGKGTPDIKRDESMLAQIPTGAPYSIPQFSQPSLNERISDERNRASQKQKVIEEREKLKAEQEARQKKLHYLRTELNRLSKQQGELLRKKRREKDGHKDPLLVEVNRLQENIVKEIAQLKINADAAEKKQSELDKVAQILGINIFEKSRKLSSENKDTSEKNKSEIAKSQERTSNSIKESKPFNDKLKGKSPKPTESSQSSKQHIQAANIYDYYDTGNHWCKDCNTTCGIMFDFFTHMHNKKHRQTLDPYNRPWASKTETETKQDVIKRIDKIPVPAKGSEFLIPVTGYYCQLCHEFFGDQISAEQHVKSHPHNEKYKKHVDENPLYEERRNLDRQAGLSVIQETERRLKRKQCEKQKEEKDEKSAKVTRKEEPKCTKELGDGDDEYETSKRKEVPNGQKCGINLKLKKDDKEVEKKEGKKEESPKESRLSSFGKFSWRKTEREEKNQDKDVSREESAEESKDKESKPQSGKTNSKPIAIKLSGKTVIPHTSPWTPVVSTSSQAKIRPNLPVPMMVLRKSATTTVSKPAPLNTFLSIKSSGATTKPLPVVKEGNPELVLAPDIISKAFGGEVVVLKSSQEKTKTPQQPEEKEHESVSKAIEHAKALEHAANAAKVQEQAIAVAKAQAKARELAAMAKEQEVTRGAKINDQSMMFERPRRRPPLLPLPPGPPMTSAGPPMTSAGPLRRPPTILLPPRPLVPPKEAVILSDDMAPGVSEDDKNILAMPMCPRPLPPPTIFRDHVNKLEKKNSSLAAGNAKDLYDIFYNNSGRSPADSKLMNSATSDKEKINPVERERNTDLLVDSKPNNNCFAQECNSSDVSKIPSGDGTAETEEVKAEKTACGENIELKTEDEGGSEKISISNTLATFKYKEALESNNLATSASVGFQNEEEMGTPAPIEFSKESPELVRAELAIQIPKRSPLPLDDLSKTSTDLKMAKFKMSDNELSIQLLEDSESNNLPTSASVPFQNEIQIGTPTPTEFIKKLPNLEKAEVARQLPERSAPAFKNDSKNPSEFETAEFKSSDDNKLTMKFSENSVSPLGDVSKNPLELKTAELAMQLPEGNGPPLEDDSKKPSELGTAEFKSPDDKALTMQSLEYTTAPLEDFSLKTLKLDSTELVMQLPEINAPPLEELHKKSWETGAAEFRSLDDKELMMQSLEYTTAPLEDLSKKPSELESAELAMQLPDSNAPPLEELHKNPLEIEAAEFKSPDDTELAVHLPEKEAGLRKEPVITRHVGVTSCEDIDEKLQDQQNTEVYDQSKLEEINSDLEVKAYVTNLGERDIGRERLEFADHNFAVSQGDKSQLFEMQIGTPKGEGPIITEEKQIDDSSEQTISTWVSDICVQSQVAWQPIDLSSKVSEENPQIVVRDQRSLGLKLGPVGIERLEPAINDECPQASEVLNIDPELKPLNKGELDSFHTNNDQDLLVNFPPKDNEAFNVVNAPSSGEMPNERLANITMVSSTVGEYEQINQQPLSCEVKDLEVERTKALETISSTTDAETSSSVELMFLRNDTQRSSESDMELSYMEETHLMETKIAIFSSIQPEMVQEPLEALPTEISVGHLGEEALTFTAMNTGVLNTSAADDFDLNSTYSELSFDQPTTLTLNLKVENERDSLKSDEIKPTDPSELKPGLELETIQFSLGDIEVEREHLSILPSEILNEDTVESPKLETTTPIRLESSKASELGIDQSAVEPQMIDYVVSASGDQEDKFCSLVSDAIVSHMGSPAPNSDTAEPSMSLIEMQGMPPVSEVLQLDVSQGCTSDMSLLSCVGKNMENQAAACMESLHPDLKKTSVEVGGSGDSELYSIKSEMQASGGEITKTEEENYDNRCGVHSKLTLEVTDNSTEHLVSSDKMGPNF